MHAANNKYTIHILSMCLGVNSRLLFGSYLVRILPKGPSSHHKVMDKNKTCIFYLEARKFKIKKFSPSDIDA